MSFSGSVSVQPGEDVQAKIREQVAAPDEGVDLYEAVLALAEALAGTGGGLSGSISGHKGGYASISLTVQSGTAPA